MRQGSAYGLTFRELTVLHLVVAGKSDKEIAAYWASAPLRPASTWATSSTRWAPPRTEAGVRAVREGLLD